MCIVNIDIAVSYTHLHLQTNKVKYIVGKTALIHSVDSLKLAETIEKEAAKKNCIQDILVEVNVAQEESKFGLKVDEVIPLDVYKRQP